MLRKGREAAIAHYLEQPVLEKDKLEEEAAIARWQEMRTRELDNRMKEEQIRREQIENEIRALEGVRFASELVAKGIIEADQVRIDINDLMYLLIHGDRIQPGHTLEEIGKNEIVRHRKFERQEANEREEQA